MAQTHLSRRLIEMQSLELVRTPPRLRRLARVLLCLLIVLIVCMFALPWQQTSRGSGKVVAYQPTERPQTVESPIYGRVVSWGKDIVEGAFVAKGQMVLEIADNDPLRAERLEEQVDAARQKLEFAAEKRKSYHSQIVEYEESRTVII